VNWPSTAIQRIRLSVLNRKLMSSFCDSSRKLFKVNLKVKIFI